MTYIRHDHSVPAIAHKSEAGSNAQEFQRISPKQSHYGRDSKFSLEPLCMTRLNNPMQLLH